MSASIDKCIIFTELFEPSTKEADGRHEGPRKVTLVPDDLRGMAGWMINYEGSRVAGFKTQDISKTI